MIRANAAGDVGDQVARARVPDRVLSNSRVAEEPVAARAANQRIDACVVKHRAGGELVLSIATQREQLEQAIQVDVRNSLQQVRSAEARLRSAGIARKASEQQYQSEQRKLDAGQSTVFLVLERQTALTTARGNELRAQTDLNKAIADLQRATGNALTTNSIVVRVH